MAQSAAVVDLDSFRKRKHAEPTRAAATGQAPMMFPVMPVWFWFWAY